MRILSKGNVLPVVLFALTLVALKVNAREISGVWWDPDQGGTGVTLLQEGEQVSGTWYFYGENGEDIWFTFVGTLANDNLSVNLLQFTGPALSSVFDPSQVQSNIAGTATLNVRAPGAIDFNYSITREGNDPATGTLNLVPFSMTVSGTERLADFAGFYTGRFIDDAGIFGTGNGIFAARVDNFGKVEGVQIFSFSGRSCSVAGTITANGEATLSANCGIGAEGASGTGVVTPSGILSGTWVSDTGLSSGTFSGSRQD